MTGRSLSRLPIPPKHLRLSLISSEFETKAFAKNEDALRSKRLQQAARSHGLQEAEVLAHRLAPDRAGFMPRTMASSRYMRLQRIKVFGGLLPLAQEDHLKLKLFTIINPKWTTSLHGLSGVHPQEIMSTLRSQLVRLGSGQADGWLFAAYHSEFHDADQLFHGHVHGIAVGGMADLIDRLRTRKCYRSARSTGVNGTVFDPIWISRLPVRNVPHAISYVLKSYWPRYTDGPIGYKIRLREPHHSEVLIWMNRYRLEDFTLLMNLKVGAKGIKRSKKRTPMA